MNTAATNDKLAGLPPPLPAAAKTVAKPLSEAGEALFGGMKQHLATKGTPNVMGGLLKGASLELLKAAFLDELEQISLEKDAFAVTDAGHKFDAKAYGAQRDMYGKRREARDEYAQERPKHRALSTGLEVRGLLSSVIPTPTLKGTGHLSGFADMLSEREFNYAAKKHEQGHNAWNPLGGFLTPTEREKAYKAEKKAFAVTEEGHKHDAEAYHLMARQAAELAALQQKYKGLGHIDEEGKNPSTAGGILRFNMGSPIPSPDGLFGQYGGRQDLHARHLEYAAKKHEQGHNAWNPWGGALTPSSHEQGGTPGLMGRIGKSVPKSSPKEASIAAFSEELVAQLGFDRTKTAGMLGSLGKG
jgi:hypothetical protein